MSAPARPGDADPVTALEHHLGLTLPDRALALAAITHKSYVNEHRDEMGLRDNERLEFLGDAVIDLAVSHRLMARFPGAREGELSKMRAAVVDEQGLSEMARALELGELLRLGRGEELTGGRQKASLLADAMEAVIAAVFLQSGLPPVLQIVDRFLQDAFARAAAGTLDRDYKTQLQELSQNRFRATPRYRVVAEHGPDHSKTFEIETDLRGEVLGRGEGRSKKDAEQAAAKLALDALGRRFADAPPAGPSGNTAAAVAAPTSPTDPPTDPPAKPLIEPPTEPPVKPPIEPPTEPPVKPPAKLSAAAVAPAPATPAATRTHGRTPALLKIPSADDGCPPAKRGADPTAPAAVRPRPAKKPRARTTARPGSAKQVAKARKGTRTKP